LAAFNRRYRDSRISLTRGAGVKTPSYYQTVAPRRENKAQGMTFHNQKMDKAFMKRATPP